MSAQPHTRTQRTPRVAIDLDNKPIARQITIRWAIARRAVEELAPEGESRIIHLELRIDRDERAGYWLVDPKSDLARRLETPEPTGEIHINESIVQSSTMITLGSDDLRCTLRLDKSGECELLYVHTGIFSALKVPGGRYEPIGCAVV